MAYNDLNLQYQLATSPKFQARVRAALFHTCTAIANEAVNDQQTLSITGSPTGGTFTLTFASVATVAIAFNASAAAVQLALQNLAGIGNGNVACTGGPLPGTAVVVNFIAALGNTAQNPLTHTDSFTGGSTPAAAIAHTTIGVGYPLHTARQQLVHAVIGNLDQYVNLFAFAVADNTTVQGDLNADGTLAGATTEATVLNDIEFTIASVWNTFI